MKRKCIHRPWLSQCVPVTQIDPLLICLFVESLIHLINSPKIIKTVDDMDIWSLLAKFRKTITSDSDQDLTDLVFCCWMNVESPQVGPLAYILTCEIKDTVQKFAHPVLSFLWVCGTTFSKLLVTVVFFRFADQVYLQPLHILLLLVIFFQVFHQFLLTW